MFIQFNCFDYFIRKTNARLSVGRGVFLSNLLKCWSNEGLWAELFVIFLHKN